MIIHIFAGSKGGIGKTRCCISTGLYYLCKKNVDISLFDANCNNIDFFTIMTGADYRTFRDYKKNVFFCKPIVPIKHNGDIKGLYSNCYLRSLPFELYSGINDFWNNIYFVAEKSIRNKRNYLIVDTNLTVPNLISLNDNSRERTRRKFEKLYNSGVKKILIWYVWCLNDFLGIRDKLNSDISRMMENLQDVSYGLFSVQANLIHILNPYLFFKAQGGLLELIKGIVDKTKPKLDEIGNITHEIKKRLKGRIGFPFDVAVEMVTVIVKYIVKNNKDKGEVNLDKLIAEVKKINDNPLNMVVLEKSEKNYFYIKDQLISVSSNTEEANTKNTRDYEDIHKDDFGKETLWKKINGMEDLGIIK